MSIHEWLTALVLQVEDENCVDIDENGFVAYNYFFVTIFVIFENIDMTVINIQLPPPFNNKLIDIFTLIWIVSLKSQNEES